jgi:hypothetical protein
MSVVLGGAVWPCPEVPRIFFHATKYKVTVNIDSNLKIYNTVLYEYR